MLFSIIIPVYNVELYLRDCLDSVINQDGNLSYEVICINDGSTDGSVAILDEYKDKVTIIHQNNKGLSGARNAGLERAKGQFVWFIDSDDMIRCDSLLTLKKIIDTYRVEVVLFGAENIFESKNISNWTDYVRKTLGCFESAIWFSEENDNMNYFPSACMYIFNREKYANLTFEPNILHEDNLFTTLMLFEDEHASIYSSDERLFLRRLRENSIMTSRKSFKHFDGYYVVATKLTDFMLKRKIMNSAYLSFLLSMLMATIITANQVYLDKKFLPFVVRVKIWSLIGLLAKIVSLNKKISKREFKILLLIIFPELLKIMRKV